MKFTDSAPDGKYKHIYVCSKSKIINFDKKISIEYIVLKIVNDKAIGVYGVCSMWCPFGCTFRYYEKHTPRVVAGMTNEFLIDDVAH